MTIIRNGRRAATPAVRDAETQTDFLEISLLIRQMFAARKDSLILQEGAQAEGESVIIV